MSSRFDHLLVVGLGYAAARYVALHGARWARITASVRTLGKADEARAGARLITFDGCGPAPALSEAIAEADAVLMAAPPSPEADPLLGHHGDDLMAAARGGRLTRLVYLSSVGVYGDHAGRWVDEDTPCRPVSPRSRLRLATEAAWRSFAECSGIAVCILRLAGIYGPGRSAVDQLRAGTARRIVKPGQVFNRIHVDDIASVIDVALVRGAAGTFNVCDDEPALPQDVVTHAARLTGMCAPPEIPFEIAELSPMARSFYDEAKRVSNRRMKRALGVRLKYPSYREGLAAILAGR